MKRRNWIKKAALLQGAFLFHRCLPAMTATKPTSILIVSGWQDVNIGDIAHTPGLLNIFQTMWPEARITLWKKSKGEPVNKLLTENFPKVKIIYGNVDEQREVDSEEVKRAFADADLMVHGSGPSVVGQAHLEAWVKHTGKPFGIFGTTIQQISPSLKELLQKASFIYTRETASLKVLADNGISGKNMAFAPDATFFMDLHNDELGDAFLKEKGLEKGKFICAIPRLRYTPYHKFNKVDWTPERIAMVEETNLRYKEQDHAKLREAMIAWVRETGNKVLVCPEMTYQVEIMDELLIDPLPEDVKPHVIKRGYWFPDEAASVYAQTFAVLSFECHSPIIAAANNTPFFYLRQPEDTIKGQMYYDLGFDDWVFEIDQTTGKQVADRLRNMWEDYEGAKGKIEGASKNIREIYSSRVAAIQKLKLS